MVDTLLGKICENSKKHSDIELKKIKIGLEIIQINMSKIFIIFLLGLIFGCIVQTIIVTILFISLRMYSFGLHAKSNRTCTLMAIFTHIFTPLIVEKIYISPDIMYIGYIVLIYCFYQYAPADTEKHPILNHDFRKKLKIKACMIAFISMFILYFTTVPDLKEIIFITTTYVVIGILPITYKILKRRYNNYEEYERV